MRRLIQRWLTLEPIRERAERRELLAAMREQAKSHEYPLVGVDFSPDGRMLVQFLHAVESLREEYLIAAFNQATRRAARSRRFDPQP